jgi:hypothetical protein
MEAAFPADCAMEPRVNEKKKKIPKAAQSDFLWEAGMIPPGKQFQRSSTVYDPNRPKTRIKV